LADFIAFQIITSKQRQDPLFQKGLTFGLYSMAKSFVSSLRLSKVVVTGLRISCKGRWIKTNTGRSKQVNLVIGSINNKRLSSSIYEGTASNVTKFGSFTIKVIVDYRKSFNSC
jgi:hypothetical protein